MPSSRVIMWVVLADMIKKRILIRADSSVQLGYGHIHRCLTLAHHLKKNGCEVEFACQALSGNIAEFILEEKFKVHLLPCDPKEKFDWQADLANTLSIMNAAQNQYDTLIVDHYGIDHQWEEPFYNKGLKIFVIDDLADKKHYCRILMNPTFHVKKEAYDTLVEKGTDLLLGEKFVLLRPEFATCKEKVKPRNDFKQPKVHMFFGSVDAANYCLKFSRLLLKFFDHLQLKVITRSPISDDWVDLKSTYASRIDINAPTKNMAKSMMDCDIAFGAPGITTWERAAMGLAGIYIASHQNQIKVLNHLQNVGLCHFLGLPETLEEKVVADLNSIFSDHDTLRNMSQLGFKAIDGLGTTRVSRILMEN